VIARSLDKNLETKKLSVQQIRNLGQLIVPDFP
jgi:hypothetical protein